MNERVPFNGCFWKSLCLEERGGGRFRQYCAFGGTPKKGKSFKTLYVKSRLVISWSSSLGVVLEQQPFVGQSNKKLVVRNPLALEEAGYP